ncbi:S-layer homology domain-containing protein [Paenibacillus sophorae]|uniref:S-layer homology domain-containing protein n=1 Tax=Paenibacillus sophorae TaxID=1333845 RepID=A0ABX8H6T3_9BACL|nr:FG-GAP-like repeat-containing protein [Paenibacillus sophorae]QWU13826.1 S-layer homology domain-containing protein [Paenibacillus sophorae]
MNIRYSVKRLLPAVLATMLFVPGTGYASPALFQNPYATGITKSTYSMSKGDINRDGLIDLILIENSDNRVSVILGKGDGTFASPVNYAVGSNPRRAVIDDFNKDAFPDLAVTNSYSNSVSVLLGKADGTFMDAVNFSAGDFPVGIVTADFDSNGTLDLVVTDSNSTKIALLKGNGNGTFQSPVYTEAGGQYPVPLAASDFNRDGIMDLVIGMNAGDILSILMGGADGTFESPVVYPARGNVTDFSIGDFNDDSQEDIAVLLNNNTGGGTGSFYILSGKGDGTFTAGPEYGADTFWYPLRMTMGDFDGDGFPDLVVHNQNANNTSMWYGDGSGGFNPVYYPVSVHDFATGDFNRDGKDDLAYTDFTRSLYIMNSAAEGELEFSDSQIDVAEDGDSAVVTVNRNVGSYGRTQVRVMTSDGTAAAGTDYVPVDEVLTFDEGETSKTVTIPVIDNAVYSAADRSFRVQLSSPTNGATLGAADSVTVAIHEDDASDSDAPVWPVNGEIKFTNVSHTAITLNWPEAVDDTGVTGYAVYMDGARLNTVTGSTYSYDISGLAPATAYHFSITAVDAYNHESAGLTGMAATLPIANSSDDTTAPVWPSGSQLILSNVSPSGVTLNWPEAVDDTGVAGYAVYMDGARLNTVTGSTYSYDISGLAPATAYHFSITAVDAYNHESAGLTGMAATLPIANSSDDTTAPVWPSGSQLILSNVSRSGVTLNWPEASDDVGTAGYEIYKDGAGLNTVTGSTYAYDISGLSPATTYTFSVRAVDAAGNVSIELTNTAKTQENNESNETAPLSSNANLKALSVVVNGSVLALSPAFKPEVQNYKAGTTENGADIYFAADDSSAKVTVNGTKVKDSLRVSLQEGDNLITVAVQAENGSIKTYRIMLHREAGDETQTETESGSTVGAGLDAAACTFTDIIGHWAKNDICAASSLGIVNGLSADTFRPNGVINRAEFTAMLIRTLRISSDTAALSFPDRANIPVWAEGYVSAAVRKGIIIGFPDGSFHPEQPVSRAEMAVFIYRAINWQADKGAASRTSFSDDAEIPAWAKPYVAAATEHDLLQGQNGNRFAPSSSLTRAEAAVIMLRLSKLQNQ